MSFNTRESGFPLVKGIPWGSSFCQVCQTRGDMFDILVPYFRAGLNNNERCLWLASGPSGIEEARKALKDAVRGFGKYEEAGQAEIIPYTRWTAGRTKHDKELVSALDKAVMLGFDGLRLAIDSFPQEAGGKRPAFRWADSISSYNVIAAFAYPRDMFDALGLMEVIREHRFALVRDADAWEVIESSEARTVKDALKRSEQKLKSLFINMSEGFAYHRIVLDGKGKPADYVFLEVNDAFERLTGLKGGEVLGKKATQVLPGIEDEPTDWIGRFGDVAMNGKPATFESYSGPLGRWYSVSAFSTHKGFFAVTFNDITERKRAEDAIRAEKEKLEILAESARMLLSSETPEIIVQTLCEKVMKHLGCQAFFNYVIEEGAQRMHLNAWHGIPETTAKEIEFLDIGAAVCGCVARDGQSIIASDIQNTPDKRTDLVRSLGIQAYACHPLLYQRRTIGTLSFGTRDRKSFSDDDLDLMKTVTDQVATAMARKRVEEALRESERRVRRKLESVLSPEGDMGGLELADIIDVPAIQKLMEDFHELTGVPVGLLDVEGRVLVGVGWQDVCIKFHRVHPESRKYCTESDTMLSAGVPPGEFRLYRCKNNMWDIATPITVGGKHLGNIFIGQFFFEGEAVDYGYFRSQARRYGFDEEGYMAALEAVPRLSREKAEAAMAFYMELAQMLSQLGYSNIKLARSLSERDLAEMTIRKLNGELEQHVKDLTVANKELEAFSYSVSHDLRAPLRHIQGFVELLVKSAGGSLDEKGARYLKTISGSAVRMGELIDDLLSFSRMGRAEMHMTRVEIGRILEGVIQEMRPETGDRDVSWRVGELPLAYGDPSMLRLVVLNLVSNALKFTATRAHAVVEVGSLPGGEGEAVYFVRDNGVGFDMRYADKLFGVFQRLHKAEEFEGTGIGLANVRRIISRHGGRTWADGAPGEGATIYFSLPVIIEGAQYERD